MDYLPIQVSSVPSEHAFSSAAKTDTSRRNRISPVLMEALQMLKFSYNSADAFDFMQGTLMHESDLSSRPTRGRQDLLGRLTQAGITEEEQDDIMDHIIQEVA